MHAFAVSEAKQGACSILCYIETSMNLRVFAALLLGVIDLTSSFQFPYIAYQKTFICVS